VGPRRDEERGDRTEGVDRRTSVVDRATDERALRIEEGHLEKSKHDKAIVVHDEAIRERSESA